MKLIIHHRGCRIGGDWEL